MGRKKSPINVSLLATPDTTPSTLFGLFDIFSSVGIGWETFISGEPPAAVFNVKIVSVQKEPFLCEGCGSSILVTPHATTDESLDTDIAIVGSFIARDALSARTHDERELRWLVELKERGTLISAMCTSSVLLAETGLLDGYDATTFWVFRDLARVRFPKVNWRIDEVLCIGGDNDRIITAGSSTIWQELALFLIERYCGAEQANNVAKLWVIPNRLYGQLPFAVQAVSHPHDDELIRHCQTWAEKHYAHPSPVSSMIELTGLASTTFARRFRRATEERPIDYIHMLRMEKAKILLEQSSKSIEDIGYSVGYEDPASFRRTFKRKTGIAPKIYRRNFATNRFGRVHL